jgi:hypothetical protein
MRSWNLILSVQRLGNSNNQNWAPRAAATRNAGQELTHVRCRSSVGGTAPKLIEDFLQLIAPRNDHANADCAKVK